MQTVAALLMRMSDGLMLLSDSAAATVSAKVIHAASIPSSSSSQSLAANATSATDSRHKMQGRVGAFPPAEAPQDFFLPFP